jgi:hypothetical protein
MRLSASDDFADRRVVNTGQLADLPQGQARLLSFLKDLLSFSLSARGLSQELFLCRFDGLAESFAVGIVGHGREPIDAGLFSTKPWQRVVVITSLHVDG